MTIVRVPKQYLVAEDQDSITIDLPESIVKQLRYDYGKVRQAQGILKDRKAEMLAHLAQVRQEWE
ncbi:hypothetical protein IQ250_22670 [Pseudanabaenaceae cyanobacterium LEGE 13415]|nr:hypothetical protein [Pseudanabaenaceae cyanobacterium LEGE 13415]